MAYPTPFQAAILKDKSLKDGGNCVIRLNRDGVKDLHKQTINQTFNSPELKVTCSHSNGTTYSFKKNLAGDISDLTVKPDSKHIDVHFKKTSDFKV